MDKSAGCTRRRGKHAVLHREKTAEVIGNMRRPKGAVKKEKKTPTSMVRHKKISSKRGKCKKSTFISIFIHISIFCRMLITELLG